MYRKKEKLLVYKNATQTQSRCPFCHPELELMVERGADFFVIKNKFGFDIWDMREVEDHLMLIPNEHLNDFHEFKSEIRQEYFDLLEKFSKLGYDSFTRSAESQRRTQAHIHTHLIKTKGQPFKNLSYQDDSGELEYSF